MEAVDKHPCICMNVLQTIHIRDVPNNVPRSMRLNHVDVWTPICLVCSILYIFEPWTECRDMLASHIFGLSCLVGIKVKVCP